MATLAKNDGDLVFGDGDSIFGNFQSFHLSLGNLLDFRRMLLNFFGIVVLWCCGDFLDTQDMFVPRKSTSTPRACDSHLLCT